MPRHSKTTSRDVHIRNTIRIPSPPTLAQPSQTHHVTPNSGVACYLDVTQTVHRHGPAICRVLPPPVHSAVLQARSQLTDTVPVDLTPPRPATYCRPADEGCDGYLVGPKTSDRRVWTHEPDQQVTGGYRSEVSNGALSGWHPTCSFLV